MMLIPTLTEDNLLSFVEGQSLICQQSFEVNRKHILETVQPFVSVHLLI